MIYESFDKLLKENIMSEAKVSEAFKQALFNEYEVADNPKREQCFYKAWEMGHSSGYSEVEIYFMDLVDLIK